MIKPTILVFSAGYLPGYRWGGPVRSIASLVELLGDEFNFKIVTCDRDLGTNEPYTGITPDVWVRVGKAEVYYASEASLRFSALLRLMRSVVYDVLYLNSFFSLNFTIKPLLLRRMQLIPEGDTIIAPRGEFSSGALVIKQLKKRIFINITRIIGLYRNVLWQASSAFEAKDIQNSVETPEISMVSPVIIAPDLATLVYNSSSNTRSSKRPGKLDIVFVSRLSPKKNLDGALSMLKGLEGDITFNVYGPAEDHQYLQACQSLCAGFDNNIKVFFHGEIEHGQVYEIFSSNHLFFFPTHGENFGHVILEALFAGCPVLLSDQTPWVNLDILDVGWDIPLNQPDKFKTVLEHFVAMDDGEFSRISECAMAFGKSSLEDPVALEQNRHLFNIGTGKIKITAL